MNEAETRAEDIDPKLKQVGWNAIESNLMENILYKIVDNN